MYSSQVYIYAMTGDFTYPTSNNGKKRYIDGSFFIEKKKYELLFITILQ